uniref:putative nuclease HARBI1 n=1 Tax=Myxine glutinosa TaxID=7769 RepID=UPI00358E636F
MTLRLVVPPVFSLQTSIFGVASRVQVTLHYDTRREHIAMAGVPLPLRRLEVMLARLQMEQQKQLGAVAAAVLRRRNQRQYWVRPWIGRRSFYGNYANLMRELERESQGDFTNYMRMEPRMFHELLLRVTPRLTKLDTNYRRLLKPGLKLAITLRYMATGNSYHSLSYSLWVPHNTISGVVNAVSAAIMAEYEGEVFDFLTTPKRWRQVAEQFGQRWNFHHACGALDGKHIAIKAPKKSGTLFYNYKGFFSIVLLGLVGSEYKFLWVDIGSNGSSSESGIFNGSALKASLETGDIRFLPAEPLPNDNRDVPYFFIGDDAFALRTLMMKPFGHRNMTVEERIFNYRLSRGRRIVENAFGMLAHRWRCILTTMQQEHKTVKNILSACLCLHNMMWIRYPRLQNRNVDREGNDHQIIPGACRNKPVLQDMQNVQGGNRATREAKAVRVYLKHYYNNVGSVPWQDEMI